LQADLALFELECRIAEKAGDWPQDASGPPPAAWLERSPAVAAAYARSLAGEGRFGEAKPLLAFAVRGFARQGAAGPLRAAVAWLAVVALRLGDVAEAETGLRFLRDDGEAADDAGDSAPDADFALGRGGYLIGLSPAERLRRFEAAAIGFANGDRRERSLEAAFERMRLAAVLGASADDTVWGATLRQKAAWNPAYAWHAKLLDDGEAGFRAPFGPYYRTLANAVRLRERLLRGDEGPAEDAERLEAELRDRDPADVELQAERHLLAAARLARAKRAADAKEALRAAETLLAVGLAPEYGRAIAVAAASADVPEPEAVPVRVRCFGSSGLLERAGEPIKEPRWKRKKAQELFFLLLLRPGHAMPKEHAIDALFGGDVEPAKAANQLYVAIHEIRRVLKAALGWHDGAVLRDGVVALPEAYVEEVDVEKYMTLVRVAEQLRTDQPELSEEMYETAAELYGPLLPNKPYIEWLDRLRDELERKQSLVLERLYLAALRRSDAERAERFARAWRELDPFREDAVQALLRLLLDAGRAPEAANLYAQYERRLRDELGARPSPETKKLLEASVRKM